MRLAHSVLLVVQLALAVLAAPLLDEDVPTIDVEVTLKVQRPITKRSTLAFSVVNTGSNTYQILNTPNSLFTKSSFTFQRFYLANKDEQRSDPSFNGIQSKWDIETAVKKADFYTFRPGGRFEVSFELFDHYDFSKSGPGTYQIMLPPYVHLVGTDGRATLAKFKTLPKDEIEIARPTIWQPEMEFKNVDVADTANYSTTVFNFLNCPPDKQQVIRDAANRADRLANSALNSLANNQPWSALLIRWFGNSNSRKPMVRNAYYLMRPFEQYTYDCACTPDLDKKAFAATHLEVGTWDFRYGVTKCRNLAQSFLGPIFAVRNADSYEYYAEDLTPNFMFSVGSGALSLLKEWLSIMMRY